MSWQKRTYLQTHRSQIMYKKGFSMLMTLLVIIVFSLIVMLGLKISSLQLESYRYYLPMVEFYSKQENIIKLFKIIFFDEIKKCPEYISIKYDNRYEINSSIVYTPTCHPEDNKTQQMQIIVNIKIFDKKNNLSVNKVEYISHK